LEFKDIDQLKSSGMIDLLIASGTNKSRVKNIVKVKD
jgi:hypothetical protein